MEQDIENELESEHASFSGLPHVMNSDISCVLQAFDKLLLSEFPLQK